MLSSLTSRINTFLLVLIVLMAASIIAILASHAGAGPLDPPAPPASTMHDIIFQPASCAGFPIVISAPGSYQLGSDITGCSGKDGMDVTTSNVTIDLSGHNLSGGGFLSGSLIGIKNTGANGQIIIKNGQVQQWGGSGIDLTGSSDALVDDVVATYNGGYGIIIDAASTVTNSIGSANGANATSAGIGANGSNNRVSGCQTDSNKGAGVLLNADGTVVEDCEVSGNSAYGIFGANIERVQRNHVHNNFAGGVWVGTSSTIDDNSVLWNGAGGVSCGPNNCSISHNTVGNNGSDGVDVAGGVGVVADNDVFGNTGRGIYVAPVAAGFPNVVLRNVGTGNVQGNCANGSNNDVGPEFDAAGATSPANNYNQ